MNCIIIEDQQPAQEILQRYIADMDALTLTGTFTDALQAMETVNNGEADLIFLDIHLPKLSGLDYLKTLKDPPAVILTTAFPDYALESYDLDVADYLLKPFSFQRFVKAVNKVVKKMPVPAPEMPPAASLPSAIFFKSGYDHIKVSVDDILFLTSDTEYTEIHTADKKHLSADPLRHWEERLAGYNFLRIHKSYIIHLSRVLKVSGSHVYLSGDICLPVGRAYKEEFYARLQ